MMIIGLTGKNASGKGEVATYLKTKGFIYYSLSDELREEATRRKLDHSRETLISLGNELREKFGPEYLAKKINEKIKNELKNNARTNTQTKSGIHSVDSGTNSAGNGKNFVVDSIRSPFEAKELLKNRDFLLVGIHAPVEIRFERLLKRGRAGDSKTLEEFKKHEEQENTSNKNAQQLDETFKLAGKVIDNSHSLDDLHKKIDELLDELSKVKF